MRGVAVLLLALPLAAPAANAGDQIPQGRKEVAENLKAPDRGEKQRPKELVQAVDLLPGMTVADVGTGIGYMLPFFSRAVGPYGKVIAEDTCDDYLAAARVQNNSALHNIRLNKPDVIKEIEANHFRTISEREQIKDSQYMLILERN
ncbi:MAG TPA: hypothetical protein VKV17_12045 [Bryobacteraceae bacterium]|nr:hypothetical protein [Bryobacteraceae bacterium]